MCPRFGVSFLAYLFVSESRMLAYLAFESGKRSGAKTPIAQLCEKAKTDEISDDFEMGCS